MSRLYLLVCLLLICSLIGSSFSQEIETNQDKNIECGQVKNHASYRISNSGGLRAGEVPFMVRIGIDSNGKDTFCSGVIISETLILTAAQCVAWIDTSDTKVYAVIGDYSTLKQENEIILKIANIKYSERRMLPNLKQESISLAILETSKPIEFKLTDSGLGSANKICLPDSIVDDDYESYEIAGWGYVDKYRKADILRRLDLKGEDNSRRCREATRDFSKADVICASSTFGGPCQEDAGGPLMVVKNGKYYLQGIITYNKNFFGDDAMCLDYRIYPGIYSKITAPINYKWLLAELKQANKKSASATY